MSETKTGIVRKWDESKGWGFIDYDGGKKSAFAHFTDLPNGRGNLTEGQAVAFEVEQAPKGPRAHNVRPVDE